MDFEDSCDWLAILGLTDNSDETSSYTDRTNSDFGQSDLDRSDRDWSSTDYNNSDVDNSNNIDIDLEYTLSSMQQLDKDNSCIKCDIPFSVNEGGMFCKACGFIKEQMSHSLGDAVDSVEDNSSMSFKIVGKNCYNLNRSFYKTCSIYTKFSKHINRKDLHNFVYQYEGRKIPKNVVELAIELFSSIKEAGYVFRGNGKKGVMGSCLFYACVILGVTKTPREIASIMKIEERFLSSGDRVIQQLNEMKIINIPTQFNPLEHYIHQYFPALNIPIKYKPFIMDLIERSEKFNIHIKCDSRMTTKCVGAIYLLTTRVKELNHITKEDIVKECSKISRSTFLRYYTLLVDNYPKLKYVFKKHGIRMPKEWKTSSLAVV